MDRGEELLKTRSERVKGEREASSSSSSCLRRGDEKSLSTVQAVEHEYSHAEVRTKGKQRDRFTRA